MKKNQKNCFNSAIIDQFIKLVDPVLPLSMLDSYLANIVNEVKTNNQNMQNMDDDKIKEAISGYLLRII